MVTGGMFGSDMSLLQCIAALHVLYHKYRSQIMWFGQLVGHSPEIMIRLPIDQIHYHQEMVIFIIFMGLHLLCLLAIDSTSTSSWDSIGEPCSTFKRRHS